MGLTGGRKGKSGTWSTDVTELERLSREGVPIARLVLDWRQLTKLKSTYTDALQEQINPETGRVHTCYSLSGAQTGRLSSTDPNLQNIPIRTEIGRRIRDAFVAEPGHVILSADYSQIELRLAAHMADVPQLREAFARGDDIHNMTAQRAVRRGQSRHPRQRPRRSTSRSSTASRAGASPARLGVTAEEAQAIDRPLFRALPRHHALHRRHARPSVRETGFTDHPVRPQDPFPADQVQDPATSARAPSAPAINAPIQGTGADIIKRAMARMGPALAAAGLARTRMLLQVHDELVFEVPEDEVEAATGGDPRGHGRRRRAGDHAQRAARRRDRHRAELGRRALTAERRPSPDDDIAALARGGRTNFFGFLLRLAARLPFLFIAGRYYGAERARPLRLCGDRRSSSPRSSRRSA